MDDIVVSGAKTFDRVSNANIHGPAGMARSSGQNGPNPTDIGLTSVALGRETRHCIIHDVHNVGWWSGAVGILYDVQIGGIGWTAKDGAGHGQTLYSQNFAKDGVKVIEACVFEAGYSGFQIYATNSELIALPEAQRRIDHRLNKISGYLIQDSIWVGKRALIGGVSVGAHDVQLYDCAFIDCALQMGYGAGNGDGAVRGCLLTNGLMVTGRFNFNVYDAVNGAGNIFDALSWRALAVTGNTIIGDGATCVNVDNPSRAWTWDNNTYYSTVAKPFIVNGVALTFAEWKARTGFDANSTFVAGLPSAPITREYHIAGLGKMVSNVATYVPKGLEAAQGKSRWWRKEAAPVPDGRDEKIATLEKVVRTAWGELGTVLASSEIPKLGETP